MDTRSIYWMALAVAVAAAGCNREGSQEKTQQQSASDASAVRGTQNPAAIVPASPDRKQGPPADKGGSPHAGTAQPPGDAGSAPPPGQSR